MRECSFLIVFLLFASNVWAIECIDNDGDGWGWDGQTSCAMPCVDSDGDGWGWNGAESCIVPTACVDTDGDGWGWDGTASCLIQTNTECVDSDGDGWGWDGTNSCRVDTIDNTERPPCPGVHCGGNVSVQYQVDDTHSNEYVSPPELTPNIRTDSPALESVQTISVELGESSVELFGNTAVVAGLAHAALGSSPAGYAEHIFFEKMAGQWKEQTRIQLPIFDELFTKPDVAINDQYALISDPGGGVVMVYEKSANGWVEATRLTDPNSEIEYNNFGLSVSLDDNRAVIASNKALHLYEKRSDNWVNVKQIDGSNPQGRFPWLVSVAMKNNTIVSLVGGGLSENLLWVTHSDSDQSQFISVTGISYFQNERCLSFDGNRILVGNVVFTRAGDSWQEEAILNASQDAVIGSSCVPSSIDGNRAVFNVQNTIYVFVYENGQWNESAHISKDVGGVSTDGNQLMSWSRGYNSGSTLSFYNLNDRLSSPRGCLSDSAAGTEFCRPQSAAAIFYQTQKIPGSADTLRGNLKGTEHFSVSGNRMLLTNTKEQPVVDAYQFADGKWQLEQKLTPGNEFAPHFGYAVTIDGDTALITALGAASSPDEGESLIHRFEHDGSRWVRSVPLNNNLTFEYFHYRGQSLSLSGDTIVVGSRHIWSGGTSGISEIFGLDQERWSLDAITRNPRQDTNYNSGAFGGSVSTNGYEVLVSNSMRSHLYEKINNKWSLTAQFELKAPSDYLGHRGPVELGNNIAAIADYRENQNTGSVHVFEKIDRDWQFTTTLTASDGAIDDFFGSSIALASEKIVVGARGDNDLGNDSGSAYVFERSGGVWQEVAKLLADDGESGRLFGYQVAATDSHILVGAAGENSEVSLYYFPVDLRFNTPACIDINGDGVGWNGSGICVSQ